MALVIAALLTVWAVTPGRPLPADAPAATFSAGRAMRDVRMIARAPHMTGSVEDRRVMAYLLDRLSDMELSVAVQPVPLSEKARVKLARQSGAKVSPDLRGGSIIGLWPGRDRSAPAVVLMAHHDTVGGSPGAADDTIGVAAILETVRALRAGPPPRRDLIILFTDGEELATSGAEAFFAQAGLRDHVGVVINAEARGGGGRAAMFETGRDNGAMMQLFQQAVPTPSAASLAIFVYRRMPNYTDLTEALKHDIPGFNFAVTGRAALYHSPLSTPDRIEQGSVQDMGQQVLALSRALTQAEALPAPAPDRVFSDVWGTRLVTYPLWGGWVILGVSVLLVAIGVRGARSEVRGREVAIGLALPFVLLLGGAVLLLALNWLSGAGAGADYYDRLAAIPRLRTQAFFACLALLLPCLRWGQSLWSGWLGLIVVWGLVSLVAQIVAPLVTPILHWPLLVAALQMAIAGRLDPAMKHASAIAPVALLAAGAGAQSAATGLFLFGGVGAGVPVVALFALYPIALVAWPVVHRLASQRVLWIAAAGTLIVAIILALTVRLDPLSPSAPTYATDKR